MMRELSLLGWPGEAAGLLERRRAAAIVERIRALAGPLALLTVTWIAVDAATLPAPYWQHLALARLVAAAALLGIGRACRRDAHTRSGARARLAALFAIPAAFFAAALAILANLPHDDFTRVAGAAYSFVPFVLAAGLAAFPLALGESALLAAFALATAAWPLAAGAPLALHAGVDAIWLTLLLACVGAFAAASQLELMSALVQQAIRDPLTRCLRRESGQEILEQQFRLAERRGAALAVLFADIDRFKAVNDAFGHEAGDTVLAATATGLGSVLRSSDVLVRWGGEEFVVALPDTNADEAVRLIERLRVTGVGTLPDQRAVTVSIGIAERRADGASTAAALVELADQRMYAAKQAGRNRYVRAAGALAIPILA